MTDPLHNTIELRVRELDQLFDSMDPSPFHEKDLDRNAEEYIVANIKELDTRRPKELVVHLEQPPTKANEGEDLMQAIHKHFARRAKLLQWELRRLIRRGWISLIIGLVFLGMALLAGEMVLAGTSGPLGRVIGESLRIGGWVAMWNPMEIFLYEWWPLLGDRYLCSYLSRVPIRIVYP